MMSYLFSLASLFGDGEAIFPSLPAIRWMGGLPHCLVVGVDLRYEEVVCGFTQVLGL